MSWLRTGLWLAALSIAVSGLARAEPPQTPRTDRYGDPLPEGAVARLGTVRLRHGRSPVHCAAFSADGKLLATADGQHVHVWETATGKELARFEMRVSAKPGVMLGFGEGGKTLAAVSHDRILRVCEVSSGKELLKVEVAPSRNQTGHSGVPFGAFSTGGKTLAVSFDETSDYVLYLCDVATGRKFGRLRMCIPARAPPLPQMGEPWLCATGMAGCGCGT